MILRYALKLACAFSKTSALILERVINHRLSTISLGPAEIFFLLVSVGKLHLLGKIRRLSQDLMTNIDCLDVSLRFQVVEG